MEQKRFPHNSKWDMIEELLCVGGEYCINDDNVKSQEL